MEVRALASDQPVAPRKARLVCDAIKGRSVVEALGLLEYMPHRTAKILHKLVRSAVANAENNHNLNPDLLTVKRAVADEARTLKRFRARSRGRVAPQLKRYSHIEVIVEGDDRF
jgi:large subunit ribosomal protein L22